MLKSILKRERKNMVEWNGKLGLEWKKKEKEEEKENNLSAIEKGA